MAHNWQPESWKEFEARHLPHYEDAAELADAESTLAAYPPLVFAGEARALKAGSAILETLLMKMGCDCLK